MNEKVILSNIFLTVKSELEKLDNITLIPDNEKAEIRKMYIDLCNKFGIFILTDEEQKLWKK